MSLRTDQPNNKPLRTKSPYPLIHLFIAGLFFSLLAGCNTTPQPDPHANFTPLFNQQDLSGFYTYLQDTGYKDPNQIFSVKDRTLHISGDGFGYLATKQSFRNYELILEYRWGEKNFHHRQGKARDAGLFLHATGADGGSYDADGAYKAAIECQIMEGATGDFLLIRGKNKAGQNIPMQISTTIATHPRQFAVSEQIRTPRTDTDGFHWYAPAGPVKTINTYGRFNWIHKSPEWKDIKNFRGKYDLEHPPNSEKWNTLRVRCDADQITVWLNGKKINHIFNIKPTAGQILLQCEGSAWEIKNLLIRPVNIKHK